MTTPLNDALRAPHIVAIDADRDLRRLYHTLIANAGYQVTTLPYERRSVTAVVAAGADLLLIDYLWHEPVAGRVFLQRVRASQPWLPIIVCSTLPAPPVAMLTALRLAFVPKPFTGRQLLTTIAELLPAPARLATRATTLGAGFVTGPSSGVISPLPTDD